MRKLVFHKNSGLYKGGFAKNFNLPYDTFTRQPNKSGSLEIYGGACDCNPLVCLRAWWICHCCGAGPLGTVAWWRGRRFASHTTLVADAVSDLKSAGEAATEIEVSMLNKSLSWIRASREEQGRGGADCLPPSRPCRTGCVPRVRPRSHNPTGLPWGQAGRAPDHDAAAIADSASVPHPPAVRPSAPLA